MALAESVLVGGTYVPVSGFSANSFAKQEKLHKFVIAHARAAGETSEERPYIFLDTHGGLGLWKSKQARACLGSPILIHRVLDQHNIRFRGLVFEKKTSLYEQLKVCCAFAKTGEVHVYNMDNSRASSVLQQWADEDQVPLNELPGLIYQDYEGGASVQQVQHLVQGNNMDILVHFGTRGTKRTRCRADVRLSADLDLLSFVPEIDRRNWFITEKAGFHGFVFLHGSNTSEVPLTDDFVPITSEAGKRIIIKSVFKDSERDMIMRSVIQGGADLWALLRDYHIESNSGIMNTGCGEDQSVVGEYEIENTHRLSPPPVDFNPFK